MKDLNILSSIILSASPFLAFVLSCFNFLDLDPNKSEIFFSEVQSKIRQRKQYNLKKIISIDVSRFDGSDIDKQICEISENMDNIQCLEQKFNLYKSIYRFYQLFLGVAFLSGLLLFLLSFILKYFNLATPETLKQVFLGISLIVFISVIIGLLVLLFKKNYLRKQYEQYYRL